MNGLNVTFTLLMLSFSVGAVKPSKFEASMGELALNDDCDGTCSHIVPGYSGLKDTQEYVKVASLGSAIGGSDPLRGYNDNICRSALNSNWKGFTKDLDEMEVQYIDAITMAKCEIREGNGKIRVNHLFHSIATEKGAASAFTRNAMKYILKHNHEQALVQVVQGVEGQPDLFAEIEDSIKIAGANRMLVDELKGMKNALCVVLKRRKVEELEDLKKSNCN